MLKSSSKDLSEPRRDDFFHTNYYWSWIDYLFSVYWKTRADRRTTRTRFPCIPLSLPIIAGTQRHQFCTESIILGNLQWKSEWYFHIGNLIWSGSNCWVWMRTSEVYTKSLQFTIHMQQLSYTADKFPARVCLFSLGIIVNIATCIIYIFFII